MTQNVQLTGGDIRGLTVIVATPEAAQPPCPSFSTVSRNFELFVLLPLVIGY